MTSELRLLVSEPTIPCLSIKMVDVPVRAASWRAMASPTAPPPMTACVKSTPFKDLDVPNILFVAGDSDIPHRLRASRAGPGTSPLPPGSNDVLVLEIGAAAEYSVLVLLRTGSLPGAAVEGTRETIGRADTAMPIVCIAIVR